MSILQSFLEEIFTKKLWEPSKILKRNDILVNKGDFSKDLFFVKSGAITVTTEIEEKEQIIRFAYQNSMFAAIDSFLYNKATIYNVKTLKETEILTVSKEKLQKIFDENPTFYSELLKELIHQQSEREIDLLHHSASARFERILKRSPKLFQEVPHKYIASYLRISPETLSRLLKN